MIAIMRKSFLVLTPALAGTLTFQYQNAKFTTLQDGPSTKRSGISILYPTTQDTEIYGLVSFSQDSFEAPTKVVASIRGLNPNSTFGLQLLEQGDLTEGQQSLGDSLGKDVPMKEALYYKHPGDLGNVTTNEKGSGYNAFTSENIKLFGESSAYGRGCGLFSEPNDQETAFQKGKLLAAGPVARSADFKNLAPGN